MIYKFVDGACRSLALTRIAFVASLLLLMCCNGAKAQWSIAAGGVSLPSDYQANPYGIQYGVISGFSVVGWNYPEDDWEILRVSAYNASASAGMSTVLQWTGSGTPGTKAILLVWAASAGYGVAKDSSTIDQTANDGEGDPIVFSGLESDEPSAPWIAAAVSSSYHVHIYDTSGGNPIFITPPISVSSSGAGDIRSHAGFHFVFQVIQPASISATSTTGIPVGPNGYSDVQYVSGTACSLTGTLPVFPADSPVYITSAQLSINGTVVKSYSNNTGAIDPNVPITLSAWFDSTHFASGTSLNATFQATDSQGTNYGAVLGEPTNGTQPFNVIVTNTALDYVDQVIAGYASMDGLVQKAFQSVNYSPVTASYSATAPQMLASVSSGTGFFVETHMNADDMGDCFYNPDPPASGSGFGPTQLAPYVKSKNNTQPPYNLVLLDGCHSLGENFGEVGVGILGIGYSTDPDLNYDWSNSFGIGSWDQACIGWLDFLNLDNEGWVNAFYNALVAGNPVYEAALDADESNSSTGGAGILDNYDIVPCIEGDAFTKLTGVYPKEGLQWYY